MLKHGLLKNKKHNSYPNIVHFPGIKPKTNSFWEKIQKIPLQEIQKNPELTIFTWNNKEEPGILEKNLDRLKIEYTVLGQQIKNWNNILKLQLTNDFLKSVETKFVMGLDSIDVIVLNPCILDKFNEFNCKLLFNGQNYCYPKNRNNNEIYEFVLKEQKEFNSNLNAGAWIGETNFCKKFFSECLNAKSKDKNPIEKFWNISEQIYIKTIAQHYIPNEIKIDSSSKIFQVLEDESQMELELI